MVKLVENSKWASSNREDARFVRKNTDSDRLSRLLVPQSYKRARYYHAELGRFVSRDRVGYIDGLNLYRAYFVPNVTDPTGDWVCDCKCSTYVYGGCGGGGVTTNTRFVVAACNPSITTAQKACSKSCDSSQSSPGFRQDCKGSIINNWTPDQKKAFGICAKINKNPSGPCANCTCKDCEQAILDILDAIDGTWLIPGGWDTCNRWADTCVRRLPDLEKNPCVVFAAVNVKNMNQFFGLTNGHAWVKVLFCDGSVINFDNGAEGGDDHIFY